MFQSAKIFSTVSIDGFVLLLVLALSNAAIRCLIISGVWLPSIACSRVASFNFYASLLMVLAPELLVLVLVLVPVPVPEDEVVPVLPAMLMPENTGEPTMRLSLGIVPNAFTKGVDLAGIHSRVAVQSW